MSNITFKTQVSKNKSIVFDLGSISDKSVFLTEQYRSLCFICTSDGGQHYIKRAGNKYWQSLASSQQGGGGTGTGGNANILVVQALPNYGNLTQNTLYITRNNKRALVSDSTKDIHSISLPVLSGQIGQQLKGNTADSATIPSTLAVYNFVKTELNDGSGGGGYDSTVWQRIQALQAQIRHLQSLLEGGYYPTYSSSSSKSSSSSDVYYSSSSSEQESFISNDYIVQINNYLNILQRELKLLYLMSSYSFDTVYGEADYRVLRFSKQQLGVQQQIQFDIIDSNGYNITYNSRIDRRWYNGYYEVLKVNDWTTGTNKLKSNTSGKEINLSEVVLGQLKQTFADNAYMQTIIFKIEWLKSQILQCGEQFVYDFSVVTTQPTKQSEYLQGTTILRFSKQQLGVQQQIQFDIIDSNGYNITASSVIDRRWNNGYYEIIMIDGWTSGDYKLKANSSGKGYSNSAYVSEQLEPYQRPNFANDQQAQIQLNSIIIPFIDHLQDGIKSFKVNNIYQFDFLVETTNTITLRFSKQQLGVEKQIQFDIIDSNGYNITTSSVIDRRWNNGYYEIIMIDGWTSGDYKLKANSSGKEYIPFSETI